jgi:hypothetical protein
MAELNRIYIHCLWLRFEHSIVFLKYWLALYINEEENSDQELNDSEILGVLFNRHV